MFAERPAEGVAHTAQKRTQPLLCPPLCRLRRRRCRNDGGHTPKRLIKPPAGEVPERSEGGGEVKEGESGRATAGSDKRPRLNNTHDIASYGQLGGRRTALADTALKRLGSAKQCLDTAFSSDRGGAERVKHSGGGLQRNVGGVGRQPERSEVCRPTPPKWSADLRSYASRTERSRPS